MRNKTKKCYVSIVNIEVWPEGTWGLRPLDMVEVVVMVIFLRGNSVLKRLSTFWNETRFTYKATFRVLWCHWEIGLSKKPDHLLTVRGLDRAADGQMCTGLYMKNASLGMVVTSKSRLSKCSIHYPQNVNKFQIHLEKF